MLDKNELLSLIAKDKLAAVIEALLQRPDVASDSERINLVTQLSARLQSLRQDSIRGTLSNSEMGLEMNKIRTAMLDLIGDLDDTSGRPTGSIGEGSGNALDTAGRPVSKIPLGIGAVALLSVLGLVFTFECPTGTQFFVLRAVTALGIGSLAYYLAGSLDLRLKEGIKAGGSLAVLVLIYFLNPVDGLTGGDCNKQVPVTVFVHGKGGKQDMVLRQQGHIIMDVRGERKRQAISENGEAYFNNLLIGDTLRLNVDFSEPYKSTHPDSVYVVGQDGRIYLEVELQHLEKVFGRVMYRDLPLDGVAVGIGSTLRDTTDELGNYEIRIPPDQRKKTQELSFYKPGFKLLTKTAHPQTNEPLNIIMNK